MAPPRDQKDSPSSSATPAAFAEALLGRARELEELRAAVDAALGGVGRTALIGGVPGVGKTRLALEASALAARAGMRVLWGRCREEGGTPAHWPWVQILRALVQETEPDVLVAAAGRGGAILATAVPEIGDRLPTLRQAPRASAPTRFAFFDAVETLLRTLAESTPIALVLDDLHAADPSSLALVDFIAPELARARVLLVATYREHEASDNESGPVIARAARHGLRLRLPGLELHDVMALATASAGQRVPQGVVASIHRATDGNPLFVKEMVRTLAARGRLADGEAPPVFELADSIQHVIATRLEPLSAGARDLLATAAVVGRDFDVATLEMVSEVPAYEILSELQAAVDAGVLALHGGARGRVSFTHALYREFFYSALGAARRSASHVRVADALERQDAEEHVADVAFHLLEAGPVAEPERVAARARSAGEQAIGRFAYAQAVKHFEDALRAYGSAAPSEERCELLLRLAEARFRAGEGEASKAAFQKAAEVARVRGDAERLTRAALGLAGPWPMNGGIARDDVVALLRHALNATGEENLGLRATVLARLAVEHILADPRESARLGDLALALARRAGQPRAMVEAILARHYSELESSGLEVRKDQLRKGSRSARETGDDELTFRVHFQCIHVLFESGDRADLDREVAVTARLVERLRQPFHAWFIAAWRTALALVDGRLDVAERLIAETLATGQAVQGVAEAEQYALQVFQNQSWNLCLEQGRNHAAVEPGLRAAVELVGTPVLACALMVLHSAMGRESEARDSLERFAADDFKALPADWTRIPCIGFASLVCADLESAEHAFRLYELARPFALHHLSNGSYYFGSMEHHLARLAATMGRTEAAHAHFEAALRAHRRMGARCWVARTQAYYAGSLLHHGGAADRARARRLAREALVRAREIGMAQVEALAQRVLEDMDDGAVAHHARRPAAGGPPETIASPPRHVFRREGGIFRIEYDGKQLHLRHHRGLVFLARLLAHPGVELPALTLVSDDGGARGTAARDADVSATPLSDAGDLLDGQARREYRRRLEELAHELDAAEDRNDPGQVARLRRERESMERELARAVGLGGRTRRAGSHAERARINATRAISDSIARIAEQSPGLARHLRDTIKTGAFCSYRPDSRLPVRWET